MGKLKHEVERAKRSLGTQMSRIELEAIMDGIDSPRP